MENHKQNNYSQNGEDGILKFLLKEINKESIEGLCIEFGAWDGIHMSNTFNLVKNHNYNAIYIEGDAQKFQDLKTTASIYPRIHAVCEYVGQSKSLNQIVAESPYADIDIDILSIDVDGMDYKIWSEYKTDYNSSPKIVVIEINSSLSPKPIMVGEDLSDAMLEFRGVNFGTMLELGNSKGYDLIAHTGNCIFVHKRFSDIFNTEKNTIQLYDSKWLNL